MVLTNVNFFHNSVKKFFGENRKEKRDEQEVREFKLYSI